MSALSLVVSVFILRITECITFPPPRWLYRISYFIANISCVNRGDESIDTNDSQLSRSTHANDVYRPVPAGEKDTTKNRYSDAGNNTSAVVLADAGHQAIVTELRTLRHSLNTVIESTAKDNEEKERTDTFAEEWNLVARVLDRVLFFVFFTVNAVMLLVFLFEILIINNAERAMNKED